MANNENNNIEFKPVPIGKVANEWLKYREWINRKIARAMYLEVRKLRVDKKYVK